MLVSSLYVLKRWQPRKINELSYRSRDSIRARFFSSENAYLKRAPGTGGGRDSMGLNFLEASSDRLQDISHHGRFAPQDVSHPSSGRFAPVAVTTCSSLRRFAPCETFRTHGRRFAPYVRRFAPYVRRFAPYWDVSPPIETFPPLGKTFRPPGKDVSLPH